MGRRVLLDIKVSNEININPKKQDINTLIYLTLYHHYNLIELPKNK